MSLSRTDDEAFIAAFLRQVLDDRQSGIDRGLDVYLGMFPGREDVVRAAWHDVDSTPAGVLVPEWSDDSADRFIERRIGPYRLFKVLGSGGQGGVYLAEDTRLRRKVAVKVLHALAATSEELRARFRREALVTSRLDHPGICALYDSGIEGGVPYLVMRHVEGEPLSRFLDRRRTAGGTTAPDAAPAKVPEAGVDVSRVIEEAARAVHAAHEAGILHRDLKPANIMVTPQGGAVVLDFGVARVLEGEASYRTRTGVLFGTPSYLSPESLGTPPAAADRRTDVYALGVTLFEAVTGRRPFEAPTRDALYMRIVRGEPPDPRSLCRSVSRDLSIVIQTAMERDPGRRYDTALDLAEDLRRLREREPIRARPLSRAARVVRWIRRNPLKTAVFALLLAVAGLAGVLGAKWPELRAQAAHRRLEALERELETGFLLASQRSGRAVDAFSRALAIDPASLEAVAGMAIALLRGSHAGEALAWLDGKDEAARRHTSLGLLRAETLRELGRTGEADAFEAGLPPASDPLAWFIAAHREMRRGELGDGAGFQRAADLLVRCILAAPEPRALHDVVLAVAASEAGDRRLAAAVADAILARWPDSATAIVSASQALNVVDAARSVRVMQSAVDRWPQNLHVQRALGDARRAAGDFEGAVRTYREVLRTWPDHYDSLVGLGYSLDSAGSPREAIATYEEALRLAPGHPGIVYSIGCIHFQAGEYEAAVPWFEKAVALNPAYADAHGNLGLALREAGELDRALAAAREAVRLLPRRANFKLNLSSIQVSRGALREALRILDGLIVEEPGFFEARRLRAGVFRGLGRFDEAVADFREACRIRPDSREALFDLGSTLAESGECDSAVSAFRRASGTDLSGPDLQDRITSAIGRCERFLAIERRLAEVRTGEFDPDGIRDPAGLAGVAEFRGLPATAAELWSAGFDRSPGAIEDLVERHRYRAACAAARAASGSGLDGTALTPEERSRWRAQALVWLEAEVRALRAYATAGVSELVQARMFLARGLADPALLGVRDPEHLALLPSAERDGWFALWTSMEDALRALDG